MLAMAWRRYFPIAIITFKGEASAVTYPVEPDLDALTGTFECIAVNKKNTDGSSEGYRFASTINWNEGSYSWHLGS
jgi:hypothetical protein